MHDNNESSIKSNIAPNYQKIGIIGAMQEEITPLLNLFPTHTALAVGGNIYYEIPYKNATLYVAYSKIGKVHSAMTATTMIAHFGCEAIIFGGVAGALNPNLKIGDMLIATKLCQHDVDISAFGHPLGFIPESKLFVESSKILNGIANLVAQEYSAECGVKNGEILLKEGIIASGDEFVHSVEKKQWLVDNFGADAVEMEGASVAVVCDSFGVPFCVFRSISDSADGSADVSFDEFLDSSAKICAEFVKKMLDKILG
ncbi:5'-methylthioadenosine/adenosylhomocysteine nucleosidase [Helicobacter sp. T3_23-1056]